MSDPSPKPLSADLLRWRCDPARLGFETTDELDPTGNIVGQPIAMEALAFGLECNAPGQNIFVRGLTGTGRVTSVKRLLEQLDPQCRQRFDRCFVHNFGEPYRPRHLALPPGTARDFRRRLQNLAEFITDDLPGALQSESVKARRQALERAAQEKIRALTEPFEKALREAGLALVSVSVGTVAQLALVPAVEGRPVPPEEYEQLRADGKVTQEDADAARKALESFKDRLEEVSEKLGEIRRDAAHSIEKVMEQTGRSVLQHATRGIRDRFKGEDVAAFLDEVVEDALEHRILGNPEEAPAASLIYGVNVVVEHDGDSACPVVVENTPTLGNLLGSVETEWGPRGPSPSDYRHIRPGSLLSADGGFLILDARDLLSEPGSWKALVRTLRSRQLEMIPPERTPFLQPTVNPQPIPVRLRVILVGSGSIYALLDQNDADFSDLFKVLADFDSVIDRDDEGIEQYSGVVARVAREESLPRFDAGAVAALVEHGARVAARGGKLTARFGRVADIAREAAFIACKKQKTVTAADVVQAVMRTRRRAELPSRHFQELLADGTIQVQTRGASVGQINGLAVMSAGPLTYGFPARITASIGAGSAGIIDIEGQASLAGAIHTKGFQILGGTLRYLLQTDHPLAFSASLAFEQSYGGIDGDSASTAEICCLLSALTGFPLRQDLAVTGAIDQVGHVMAIGGVNEKIEGFFDTCAHQGLTGTQGVIVPHSNAGDLMLRHDVVEACRRGDFRVHAVSTVQEALTLFTGVAAGSRGPGGSYPEGTLLFRAVSKAAEFWRRSLQSPLPAGADGDESAG